MDSEKSVERLLKALRNKKITVEDAFEKLRDLPYADLGFAKLDSHRVIRKGFPEVIYAQGKTIDQIKGIVAHILSKEGLLLLTRASRGIYSRLKKIYPKIKYNSAAKIVYFQKRRPPLKKGWVTIITGGTADLPVAEEAAVTLEVMGNKVHRLYDVGVAGIHRVLDKRRLLNKAEVLIVVAGMEGALASVVGGLVSKPVIAVPTSVGYGASFRGMAALLTMLNCCAPGVTVVNIDNGFGGGYFASMINDRRQ